MHAISSYCDNRPTNTQTRLITIHCAAASLARSVKYYSQFNNVLSVLGKCSHEMATLHLTKSYCLSALLYGCETWCLTSFDLHKASVAWNNNSAKKDFLPLEGKSEAITVLLRSATNVVFHQRRLLFWQKMIVNDNIILATLTRSITAQFIAVG